MILFACTFVFASAPPSASCCSKHGAVPALVQKLLSSGGGGGGGWDSPQAEALQIDTAIQRWQTQWDMSPENDIRALQSAHELPHGQIWREEMLFYRSVGKN